VTELVVPTVAQVRSILEESHAVWGAGLSLPGYVGMWEELAASPWGGRWFSWRALVDASGRVLSSLKLYRPAVRIEGEVSRACALGAVFTPRSDRRRGHAARLIEAVLDEGAGRGDGFGFLFTDIGTDYYGALGFTPLPCEDVLGSLPPAEDPRVRGVAFRTMSDGDLDEVARGHDRCCAGRLLAVMRDREHWEFLLLRAESFFRRLDGSGLEGRFLIAEECSAPIGYVIGVVGAGEWNLREAAAYDGTPDTLRRILCAAAYEARAAGATSVWGWFPRAWFPLVPSWRLRTQPRPRAIPMLRPARGRPLPGTVVTRDEAFLPFLDQF